MSIKDLWFDKHEALCEEYFLEHPNATDEEAHEYADKQMAGGAFEDHLGDLTDQAYQQHKDKELKA